MTIATPAWSKPVTATWTDSDNTYDHDLAGVAFYTAKYDIDEDRANPIKHYTNNKMALCDVKEYGTSLMAVMEQALFLLRLHIKVMK
jgi:hypothetical protein